MEHKPTALSAALPMASTTTIVLLPKTFFDFFLSTLGFTIGGLECNVTDYVLARLPNFERKFWAPSGAGLGLVWEQIRRIALQVEQGPP